MPVSSVGTPTNTHATAGSVTGTWGAGQARTAGNVLVAMVSAAASTSITVDIATVTTGWSVQVLEPDFTTIHVAVACYTKTAAGADAAPVFTVTGTTTVAMDCMLFELYGANTTTPADTSGVFHTNTNTAGTVTMTATTTTGTGLVAAAGEFAISAFAQQAAAATQAWTDTGPGGFFPQLPGSGVSSVLGTYIGINASPSSAASLTDAGHFSTDTTAFGAGLVIAFAKAPVAYPDSMEVFANNAAGTVTGGGTDAPATGTSESLTVTASGAFPVAAAGSTQFHIADPAAPSEKMLAVTAPGGTGAGQAWTVIRGSEGTTPVAHTAGYSIVQVTTAGALGSFTWTYNVRAYGAAGNGTTDDTAAIQAAVTACINAGGGIVYFPEGTYKVSSTITANCSGDIAVYIQGAGRWAAFVSYYGSGDCFRIYGTTVDSTQTPTLGGGISGLTIDGTNASASAASSGLHMGDLTQFGVDLTVRNFTFTGSIGVHFDNNYYWTELLHGEMYVENCVTGVMFDNSANTGGNATGSFDRADLNIAILQIGATFDGVTFSNGAIMQGGRLGIVGNFSASASALTSAVLRLTGSNGAGASSLFEAYLFINVETNGVGANFPYTIYFNTGCYMANCSGVMSFQNFTVSNNPEAAGFLGPVAGDAGIAVLAWIFTDPLTPNSGFQIGTYDPPTSVTANGYSLAVASETFIQLAPTGSYTGLIIPAFVGWDGQVIWVFNDSAFTLTFAVTATSNVSTGTNEVLQPGQVQAYVFAGTTGLWYPVTIGGPLKPGAGTTAEAPLNFTSGTLETAATAGAMEYDGTAYYLTAAVSSRQVADAEQFVALTATRTFTANTTAQPLFNATTNGALTVAASTSYFFESEFDITGLSGSSHAVSLTFGGTATYTSAKYMADVLSPFTVGTFAAWPRTLFTAATIQVLAAAGTNTSIAVRLKGILRINAAGTVIPQITQGTNGAAAVVSVGSWFRIWPVGSNTVTNVGNWS